MKDFITIESLRERVYAAKGERFFDGFDEMKLALEECKANGIRVIHRKSPRTMRTAIKKLLDSPEYELTNEQKILVLNQVISDLLKTK